MPVKRATCTLTTSYEIAEKYLIIDTYVDGVNLPAGKDLLKNF